MMLQRHSFRWLVGGMEFNVLHERIQSDEAYWMPVISYLEAIIS